MENYRESRDVVHTLNSRPPTRQDRKNTLEKNKFAAVYTAGPVACDWAGAIKPESAENAENAEKA